MTKLLNRLKSWILMLDRNQRIAIIAGIFIPVGIPLWQSSKVPPPSIDNSLTEEVENQINDNSFITESNVSISEETVISSSEDITIVGNQSLNPTFSNNTINVSFGDKKDSTYGSDVSKGYSELKIAGVVLNDKNELIQHAFVEIPSYGIRRGTTDLNGNFVISNDAMTDGKDAEIKVFKEGHHTYHKTIDLNDQNIRVILKRR